MLRTFGFRSDRWSFRALFSPDAQFYLLLAVRYASVILSQTKNAYTFRALKTPAFLLQDRSPVAPCEV